MWTWLRGSCKKHRLENIVLNGNLLPVNLVNQMLLEYAEFKNEISLFKKKFYIAHENPIMILTGF